MKLSTTNGIQHYDTQHNNNPQHVENQHFENQHNETQHNGSITATTEKRVCVNYYTLMQSVTLPGILLNVLALLNVQAGNTN